MLQHLEKNNEKMFELMDKFIFIERRLDAESIMMQAHLDKINDEFKVV